MDETTKPESQEAVVDAFGVQETKPETPPADAPKGDDKKEVDIENHPVVIELKKQIEDVKREYGGNLSGQKKVIKTLEAKITELQGGKKDDGEVLHKDIKYSKDLTKEERDEMTDAEIRQMDEIAALKESQNKLYASLNKDKNEDGGEDEGEEGDGEVDDLQKLVKDTAKTLSGGDVKMANLIIESAKMFNLAGLDKKTVLARIEAAAKLVPDYKAPKEQPSKPGKPVKGTKEAEDPFGVDAIVESVGKGNDGTYAL